MVNFCGVMVKLKPSAWEVAWGKQAYSFVYLLLTFYNHSLRHNLIPCRFPVDIDHVYHRQFSLCCWPNEASLLETSNGNGRLWYLRLHERPCWWKIVLKSKTWVRLLLNQALKVAKLSIMMMTMVASVTFVYQNKQKQMRSAFDVPWRVGVVEILISLCLFISHKHKPWDPNMCEKRKSQSHYLIITTFIHLCLCIYNV